MQDSYFAVYCKHANPRDYFISHSAILIEVRIMEGNVKRRQQYHM